MTCWLGISTFNYTPIYLQKQNRYGRQILRLGIDLLGFILFLHLWTALGMEEKLFFPKVKLLSRKALLF